MRPTRLSLLFVMPMFAAAAARAQVSWQHVTGMGRGYGPVVYDRTRDNLVTLAATQPARTWIWDGVDWRQSPAVSPPQRIGHAMCYDTLRSRIIMFGGKNSSGTALNDTWTWDGTSWTNVAPATLPPARFGHTMAFNPLTLRAVMFGGQSGSLATLRSDTWEFAASNWFATGGLEPPPRSGHSMAFDEARGRIVMYGGSGYSFGHGFGFADTWTRSGSWQLETPPTSPTTGGLFAQSTTMAYDPARARVVMFVGNTGTQAWEWDGGNWTLRALSGGPSGRVAMAADQDPSRGRVLLFSGLENGSAAGDLWQLDLAGWSAVAGAPSPASLYSHAAAWDGARGRMALVGGAVGSTTLDEHWEWDGARWFRVVRAIRPPAQSGAVMVRDEFRNRLVLFGGSGETWEWDGANWLRSLPTPSPSGRIGHGMAFDSRRRRVVLFGGGTNYLQLDDTWEWDGVAWTNVTTAIRPPRRTNVSMAYDAARGVTVLYGGQSFSGPFIPQPTDLSDTWEWGGSTWQQRTPQQRPPASVNVAMAFDVARQRTILVVPQGSVSVPQTWEWDGVDWRQRATATGPSQVGSPLVYDPVREVSVLVTWALSMSTYGDQEVWVYGPLSPAAVELYGSACPTSLGPLSLTIDNGTRPWLGDTVLARVGLAPVGAMSMLWIGISRTSWDILQLPLPLDILGLTGCSLLASFDDSSRLAVIGPSGEATFALSVPQDPQLLGLEVFAQAVAADPAANAAGYALTNGLALRLGGR